MFGSHTARPEGRQPLLANSSKKRLKRKYEKQRPVPMPLWSPVAPRPLRDESYTPLRARRNVWTG